MPLARRSNPADCHPNGVTGITVHGFLNVLANTQNVADGAIGVFDPHVHDAAAVGNTVEDGLHLYPALAELLADVERDPNKRTALVRYRLDHRLKLIQ